MASISRTPLHLPEIESIAAGQISLRVIHYPLHSVPD